MSQPQIGQSRNPSARIVLSGQGDVTLIIVATSADFLRIADFGAPDHPQPAIHAANATFVEATDRLERRDRHPAKAAHSTDPLQSTQQTTTAIPRAKAVASEYDAERPNSYGSTSYDCDIGPLRPLHLDEVATVDQQRGHHLGG